MNTNNIKHFAQQARLLLMEGVMQRLTYWGFDAEGNNNEKLETTTGGYVFRGQIFTDTSVPVKWNKLKKLLSSKQAVDDIIESAAYTWFNRLMAIKILETNNYIGSQIGYADKSNIPIILQNAKRGVNDLTNHSDKELLKDYLLNDKDEQAFGLLITNLCNWNSLLHDVFGRIDDYTEILLPQNLLKSNGLIDLINSDAIAIDDYKEVELIGWLYQFYISDKKDEVFKGFKKNKKARAEDIPAATQIFTPKWIVKYMVENTVGKIYLDYEPNSSLREQMKYLVQNESDKKNAAIISDITELTLIDPACGSGHILVTGFELLFKMYREEGYTAKQAVNHILEHNLFGLDIDDRAMQLARFAVLLKAAQFDASILDKGIMPKIYAFAEDTLADYFTEEYYSKEQSNWNELLGMKLKMPIYLQWTETNKKTGKEIKKKASYKKGDILHTSVIETLLEHHEEAILTDYSAELKTFWGEDKKEYQYSEFFYAIELLRQGKNLGSSLKLNLSSESIAHIKTQYDIWNLRHKKLQLDAFKSSFWNNLKPFLDILFVLTAKYTSVVANPPYMGQKSMNAELKNYVNKEYPISKSDLFAVFMEVCLNLNFQKGLMGMINQHSWMFLSSYEKLREEILKNYTINNMLHLGPRTFEELSGEVVQSTAFVINNSPLIINNSKGGTYFRLVDFRNNADKEKNFLQGNNCHPSIPQTNFSKIPGSPIAYWVSERFVNSFNFSKLNEFGDAKKGISTSDNNRFLRYWTEIDKSKFIKLNKKENRWFPYNKGGLFRKWYGNNDFVINFSNNGEELKNFKKAAIRNEEYYFLEGLTWTDLSSGKISFRYFTNGFIFDASGPCVFSEKYIYYLAGVLNSNVVNHLLSISPTFHYNVSDIHNLPIKVISDVKRTELIKSKALKNIIISKSDWDSRETSWDFKKSPLLVIERNFLGEAYQEWKEKVTQDFFQLHANEEELNRIFIEIYGLQEELTPDVALKDITILQNELDRKALEALETTFRAKGKEAIELPINKAEVLSQFVSYLIGIMMGRYRFDKPGLNIAHPNPTAEELSSYKLYGTKIEIDEDAILPIMGQNSAFYDEVLTRVEDLMLALWSENALTENINFLQESLGMDLHKWLTEKFWGYHTKMYRKKPIYWLFSSNPKKPQNAAFKVLVYMHRMDKYTVQKIQRNYLHPHQEYINREIDKLRENEESLNKEELKQLEKLQKWELECKDYNEVLKELANQQIEFDLDDGVSVNYAKFEGAVAKI